jgi:hypothetical protein
VSVSQLKPVRLFEVSPEFQLQPDSGLKVELGRIFQSVSGVIRDPVLYGFMVLLAITIPPGVNVYNFYYCNL